MNYQAIYNRLISRGQSVRDLEFSERHHIIPRCMGGSDSKENLVDLTPEEHFVAHQLLLKMHPQHQGLAHAAKMMTVGRPRNKYYGWLKRRFISECRARVGSKNPSFGTMWITNPLKENRRIKSTDTIPKTWFKGRFGTATVVRNKQTRKEPAYFCIKCSNPIENVTIFRVLCSSCFRKKQTSNSQKQKSYRSQV